MRRVAVVIVHYSGLDDLRECIRSLDAADERPPIYLADNSLAKEGIAFARAEFPHVKPLDTGGEKGWAGGANVGIRAALADGATDVLLLNPDALLPKGWLAPLLEASEDPEVGLVTGKIVYPGTPARIWSAGGVWDATKGMGTNRGEWELDGPAFAEPLDVHWASGCYLLVRKAVFDAIGLLDDSFYLYMEDLEFSDRARRAGFRIRYEPRSVAVHKAHGTVGGTRDEPGPELVYYLTRNRFLYAKATLRGLDKARVIARLVASRGAKAVAELARGKGSRAKLILRAVKDGLAGRRGRVEGVRR